MNGRLEIENKIRKLKAMYECETATINEREVAFRILTQLAKDYYVDLNSLDPKVSGEITHICSFVKFTELNVYYGQVAKAVANSFGCVMFYSLFTSGNNTRLHDFTFCGEKQNLEQVDYLVTYLIRHIRKVSTFGVFRQDKLKIEAGFADAVGKRLKKARDEMKDYFKNNQTALVKIDSALQNANTYMRSKFSLNSMFTNRGGPDKYGIGKSMGESVPITKGVGGSERKRLK